MAADIQVCSEAEVIKPNAWLIIFTAPQRRTSAIRGGRETVATTLLYSRRR